MNEYRTVEFESSDEFVEKKSRFIGYVKPVKTQDEAIDFINQIKSKHWDATHNVSAYVLQENNIQRASDDGEPSKTAGAPMLDVLLKEQIVDVCVVVTRYFGGTLLGTGGLVRAYSHGCKIAIESGHIITMSLCQIFTICVDYNFYDKLTILFNEFSVNQINSDFSEKISITFSIRAENTEKLSEKITQASNGKYSIVKIGEEFSKTSD